MRVEACNDEVGGVLMKFFTVMKLVLIMVLANAIGYLVYWVIFDAVLPMFMSDFQYINFNSEEIMVFMRGIVGELCVLTVMSIVIFHTARDAHGAPETGVARKRIIISNVLVLLMFWVLFFIGLFTVMYFAVAHPLAFTFIFGLSDALASLGLSALIVTVLNIVVMSGVYSFAYKKSAPERERILDEAKQRDEAAAAARKALGD